MKLFVYNSISVIIAININCKLIMSEFTSCKRISKCGAGTKCGCVCTYVCIDAAAWTNHKSCVPTTAMTTVDTQTQTTASTQTLEYEFM